MPAPLEGIKVLDFTRFQNGPHATVMLSDLGAEVLKVERPGQGDPGRSLGRRPDGFCSYFEALDRGKKSITLDLDDPEAKRIIFRLVEDADVVTENFRPGVMDGLGLGYEELRKHNARLIYAVNSGFGPQGPWTTRGSFDIVAQGMTGAMIAQGGGPGRDPVQIPWGLGDQVGSMIFAYGILAALLARERYGVGQRVDVSQLGAMATLQALSLVAYLHTRTQTHRFVNPTFTFYQGADDEWFTVGVLTPKHWPLLCDAAGRSDLLTDARSETPFARAEHRDWLHAQLAGTFRGRPRQHWLDALIARDVPCGPVYDYAGVEAEPQFWENGYLIDLEHPHFPGHRTVGIPLTMSETPGRVQGPAPELGQHTEETLLALGYDWEQITALRDRGAI
jgi:CoA:oxalate CoA-transferase